jgi:hypothetical protein
MGGDSGEWLLMSYEAGRFQDEHESRGARDMN